MKRFSWWVNSSLVSIVTEQRWNEDEELSVADNANDDGSPRENGRTLSEFFSE